MYFTTVAYLIYFFVPRLQVSLFHLYVVIFMTVNSSFSRRQSALSTRDTGVSSLKNCWEILKCEEKSFSTVVTGAFPPAKDQDSVIHELSAHRYRTYSAIC
jgi:hypothetical protein